jgi:hypothetical protein
LRLFAPICGYSRLSANFATIGPPEYARSRRLVCFAVFSLEAIRTQPVKIGNLTEDYEGNRHFRRRAALTVQRFNVFNEESRCSRLSTLDTRLAGVPFDAAKRFAQLDQAMQKDFASRFAGGAFVAAGLMLALGWLLLPVHIGTYFDPSVFARIHEHFHFWIWMYRIHIFGMITAVIAFIAVAALVAHSPARVLVWPGAAVASAGMIVGALAAAFYYHHGAWGALKLTGASPQVAQAFVDDLLVDTEYVTCLVRFGRVFGGLGLLVFAWGVWRYGILPRWSGGFAGLIGLVAMALTMGLPDRLAYYMPVFFGLALWMLVTGATLWRSGIYLDAPQHRQAVEHERRMAGA